MDETKQEPQQCDAWWDAWSCQLIDWPKYRTLDAPRLDPGRVMRCVMELGHEPIAGLDTGHNFGGLGPFTPGMLLSDSPCDTGVAGRADVDQLRQHSFTLNTVAWELAIALGDVPESAEQVVSNPAELAGRIVTEVERLRREREQLRSTLAEVVALLTRHRQANATEVVLDSYELHVGTSVVAGWRELLAQTGGQS